MNTNKKGALQGAPSNATQADSTTIKPGKLNNMLRFFATGGRLHRFEAARLGDSVLNTTISDLQIRHSIKFSRKRVKVPNRFGTETSVCEYWLEGEQLERGRKIVGLEVAI